ncbi:MAG TPA: dihydrodipicolinate synthase family protein, partial [Bacteroidota bacterium]
MNHDALVKYFLTVADASKIPILLYNVPKFTHLSLSLKTVHQLSGHENIVGMKDSSGNVPQLAMFKAQLDSRFTVLVGTAGAWLPALQLGIEGGILALANCCPNECAGVRELFLKGRGQEALELYQRLLPVNQAVTATYGVSGLKYACDLRGLHGGFVRTPLLPLTDSQKADLRNLMTHARVL